MSAAQPVVLDMQECHLEAMTPTEVSVDPGFTASSLFMQESTWDSVYQHAAAGKRVTAAEEAGTDSDWEVLTDPGSSVSHCGSPASSHLAAAPTDVPSRTMSPLSVSAAAAAAITEEVAAHDEEEGGLPASFNAAAASDHLMQGPTSSTAALAPVVTNAPSQEAGAGGSPIHVSRCCSVAEGDADKPGVLLGAPATDDLAIVTHPNSKVLSMDSAAGSPRPSSVDLVMAGAEMQQLRNSVSSWMQQQQREEDEFRGAEASPEIQQAYGGWFPGEATKLAAEEEMPDEVLAEIKAVQRQLTFSAHDYVLGPVGITAHRLWDWATGKLAALQSVAQELGAAGAARSRGAKPRAVKPPAAAAGAHQQQPRLNRLLVFLGASNVVMGIALFATYLNNRSLSSKIKQKDGELSSLLMRIFSLQETLQGGAGSGRATYPVICNAMSPAKHQAYL